jgi:hypothetical protein
VWHPKHERTLTIWGFSFDPTHVLTWQAGFNHSILFTVATGGATAGVYAWGDAIQSVSATTRLPSVTLSDIGYGETCHQI